MLKVDRGNWRELPVSVQMHGMHAMRRERSSPTVSGDHPQGNVPWFSRFSRCFDNIG